MIPHEQPFARFDAQFARARDAGLYLPEAAALATADATGRPSVRMVLLKGADPRGFVVYTNFESRKGREALSRRQAALCFHWNTLEQQVRVEGAVEVVSDAEADAYFATRPRGSQIGAWASRQSETVASREALEGAYHEAAARFGDGAIPRPPHWSGLRIVPDTIEFWQGRKDRLHERELYERDGEGWRVRLLQP